MRICPSVVTLELLECGLTFLACEFLGRLLSPENNNPLLVLKLDHNDIGNQGVISLAKGLFSCKVDYANFDISRKRVVGY